MAMKSEETIFTKIGDELYYIWHVIKDCYYDHVWRFRAKRHFKKAICNWLPFSPECTSDLFAVAVRGIEEYIRLHGHEVEETANKRIASMNRFLRAYEAYTDLDNGDDERVYVIDSNGRHIDKQRYEELYNECLDVMLHELRGQTMDDPAFQEWVSQFDLRASRTDEEYQNELSNKFYYWLHYEDGFDGSGFFGWSD